MQEFIRYIKKNYQRPENSLMKVIITFFLAFSALLLLKVGTLIFKKGDIGIYQYVLRHMGLHTRWQVLLKQPWTLVTYVFTQDVGFLPFISLFIQMNMLYTLGSQFIDFFNSRQFWRLYITSILFAGGSVLLLCHFFPYLQEGKDLTGASVPIYALVAAVATMMPQLPIFVVRTRYIALFAILFSLWDITELSHSTRGIAKLAGMLWGYLYVVSLRISARSFSSSRHKKTTSSKHNNIQLSNIQHQKCNIC